MKRVAISASLAFLLAATGAKAATLTVCASGCLFTDPLAAFNQAMAAEAIKPQNIAISIADGVYKVTNQLYTENPAGRFVQITGDVLHPSRVVLNFTNISGNNFSGIVANAGGSVGLIDGITVQGVGAGQTASGGRTWASQSYGSGFVAAGGSALAIGAHVVVSGFYYSISAVNGGSVLGYGGIVASGAGGANLLASNGGAVVCNTCIALGAVDATTGLAGCGVLAQSGGSAYVDGSTFQGDGVGAICAQGAGRVWAHGATGTGSGSNRDFGVALTDRSSVELTGAVFNGYGTGVYAATGSFADVDNVLVSSSANDGMVADNGILNGNYVTSAANGGFGYHAFHQGSMHLFNTLANTTVNAIGPAAADGAESMGSVLYQPSSVDIQ